MPAALSCRRLLRGIKAIKVPVNVVACNSSTTATVLGTSAARWGGCSSVLVDGWDFTSLPMSVSFGWVRGLVAEWRVGMTALLRFVRRRPERDDTAVVACSSSASIGLASSPRRRLRPPTPLSANHSVPLPAVASLMPSPLGLHLCVSSIYLLVGKY
ncbi:uncharacterized protein SCHCODRAFT_02559595, partial [Schizophyllum commune H4-8]|uniref:uncharacterized protein n=1 Tax=Schizophyllum commune (strain H4-8 / FGSC 9210) TaxID=578458 RepID=UPI00216021EA